MPKRTSKARSRKLIISKVFNPSRKIWFVLIVASLTFVALSPTLHNDFVRWDDHVYVTENDLIKELSFDNLSKFVRNLAGNFHPLTEISYALDYHFFALNPFYYHLKNLVFHLFNTVLVFFFVMRVSRKNAFMSFFAALLFGIHPMHVESVAWVSERKDVLYTFYFLIGLLLYYEYRKSGKMHVYLLMFASFLLSILSKSAAVVFPVVLLLIDFLESRKISLKNIWQKAPLLLTSLVFGIAAIQSQSEAGAVGNLQFSVFERLQYASSSFVSYIVKFFYPHELIIYRPLPGIDTNRLLFLLSVVGALVILGLLLKYRKRQPMVFFGMSFYLVTIALVLQFIPVGSGYLSDRYSYVPYIGLALAYLYLVYRLLKRYRAYELVILTVVCVQAGIYAIYTYKQTKVWRDTITLWTNLIEQENTPAYTSYGYDRRGNQYLLLGDTLSALQDFSRSVEVADFNYRGYAYRGHTYYHLREYQRALEDFELALSLNPNHIDALMGKGAVLLQEMKYAEARAQFQRILEIDNEDYAAWTNLGNVYMQEQNYNKALECFDRALLIRGDYPGALAGKETVLNLTAGGVPRQGTSNMQGTDTGVHVALTREGVNYFRSRKIDLALEAFNKALQMKPDYPEARRGRAAIYWERKEYNKTIEDITVYLEAAPDNIDMLNRRAKCYMLTARYAQAVSDYTALIEKDPRQGEYFQGRAFAYLRNGNNKRAVEDLKKARELGIDVDVNVITTLENVN